MSVTPGDDLAHSDYVTLILRLVVDRQGRMTRGELADVHGAVQGRFLGLPGLTDAVRSYLVGRRGDGEPRQQPS